MFDNFGYIYFIEACKGHSGWERVWAGYYRSDAIAKARELYKQTGWAIEIVTKYNQHVDY